MLTTPPSSSNATRQVDDITTTNFARLFISFPDAADAQNGARLPLLSIIWPSRSRTRPVNWTLHVPNARRDPPAARNAGAHSRLGTAEDREIQSRDGTPQKPRLVVLAARGTSDNAAQFGRYLIEITTGIPVSLAAPSDPHRLRSDGQLQGRAGHRDLPVRRIDRHQRGAGAGAQNAAPLPSASPTSPAAPSPVSPSTFSWCARAGRKASRPPKPTPAS